MAFTMDDLHFLDARTDIFLILEPQNPSIDVSELHKIILSTDFEALKLCEVFSQVGSKLFFFFAFNGVNCLVPSHA